MSIREYIYETYGDQINTGIRIVKTENLIKNLEERLHNMSILSLRTVDEAFYVEVLEYDDYWELRPCKQYMGWSDNHINVNFEVIRDSLGRYVINFD